MVAESLIWQLNNIFGYRNALKIAPVVTYRPKNLQYIEEVGVLKHIYGCRALIQIHTTKMKILLFMSPQCMKI